MRTRRNQTVWSVAAAIAISSVTYACASSSTEDGESTPASATAVASYQRLAGDVESAAADYRGRMMAASATAGTCRNVHEQYYARVRPWVANMLQTSGSMDKYIHEYGGDSAADQSCLSATMMEELDYHHSVACTFPDLSASQAEAARHVNAMLSYAGNVWNRCGEMMGALEGASSSWSPMMQGCQRWDGRCSMMMHDACCRSSVHDGCAQWCNGDGCGDAHAMGMGMGMGPHQGPHFAD